MIPTTLAISNRRTLRGEGTCSWARRLAVAGVDALQLREKDLPDLEVYRLAAKIVNVSGVTRVLVNGRFDLAIAAGAHGVHLRSDSLPLRSVRQRFPDLLIGKSVHSLAEVRAARDDGADYVTLSPIFAPLSKKSTWPPVGLTGLESAAGLGLPILALGGITGEELPSLASAGAAGFAGITIFQRPHDLGKTVEKARQLWPRALESGRAS